MNNRYLLLFVGRASRSISSGSLKVELLHLAKNATIRALKTAQARQIIECAIFEILTEASQLDRLL